MGIAVLCISPPVSVGKALEESWCFVIDVPKVSAQIGGPPTSTEIKGTSTAVVGRL